MCLGDRLLSTTLKRTWGALTAWDKCRLVYAMMFEVRLHSATRYCLFPRVFVSISAVETLYGYGVPVLQFVCTFFAVSSGDTGHVLYV